MNAANASHGVALVGDRRLGLLEVPAEAVARQLAQQVLLARVAAIERADADAGARCDGRDRARRDRR